MSLFFIITFVSSVLFSFFSLSCLSFVRIIIFVCCRDILVINKKKVGKTITTKIDDEWIHFCLMRFDFFA